MYPVLISMAGGAYFERCMGCASPDGKPCRILVQYLNSAAAGWTELTFNCRRELGAEVRVTRDMAVDGPFGKLREKVRQDSAKVYEEYKKERGQ
jgi:hypothetical protein